MISVHYDIILFGIPEILTGIGHRRCRDSGVKYRKHVSDHIADPVSATVRVATDVLHKAEGVHQKFNVVDLRSLVGHELALGPRIAHQ